MWLMTPHGFFSAVQDPKHYDNVMVRARVRDDLVNLKKLAPSTPIYAWSNRDYGFRVFMRKDDWALALGRMAYSIDYGNFKDEVRAVQGPQRESIYHRVWFELLELEVLPKRWGKKRRAGERLFR